jgi:flagellar biosynthetic protein FlhB
MLMLGADCRTRSTITVRDSRFPQKPRPGPITASHVAVALRYDATMAAPRLVAKGMGGLAERIRATARAHGVPVVRNPPLARALHGAVELGAEVPPAQYRAVAEVIGYVLRVTRR